jgi:hypothetical protein
MSGKRSFIGLLKSRELGLFTSSQGAHSLTEKLKNLTGPMMKNFTNYYLTGEMLTSQISWWYGRDFTIEIVPMVDNGRSSYEALRSMLK